MSKHSNTYLPAMFFTSLLSIVLIILAAYLNTQPDVLVLTWIICASAYIMGIPIGMIASPYKKEGDHFQRIGTLIAAFFSGFVVSIIGDINIETLTSSGLDTGRLLLFISFLTLGAVQTFIFRRYSDDSREKDTYINIQEQENVEE